jgi:hypothetical protein
VSRPAGASDDHLQINTAVANNVERWIFHHPEDPPLAPHGEVKLKMAKRLELRGDVNGLAGTQSAQVESVRG